MVFSHSIDSESDHVYKIETNIGWRRSIRRYTDTEFFSYKYCLTHFKRKANKIAFLLSHANNTNRSIESLVFVLHSFGGSVCCVGIYTQLLLMNSVLSDVERDREAKSGRMRWSEDERWKKSSMEYERRRKRVSRHRAGEAKTEQGKKLIMWRVCQFNRCPATTQFQLCIIQNWSFPNRNYIPFDMRWNWINTFRICTLNG